MNITHQLAPTTLTARSLDRFVARNPPNRINTGCRPIGVSADGILHATELLAAEWDDARAVLKGLS